MFCKLSKAPHLHKECAHKPYRTMNLHTMPLICHAAQQQHYAIIVAAFHPFLLQVAVCVCVLTLVRQPEDYLPGRKKNAVWDAANSLSVWLCVLPAGW